MSRRFRVALALSLASLLVPSATLARPDPESCAANRVISHALPVPADFTATEGIHRFERHIVITWSDGAVDDFMQGNEIEISVAAPQYDAVFLRLVFDWGLLPDGTLDRDIEAIRPGQPATFYSQLSWDPAGPATVVSYVQELRYETRKNRWSDWQLVPASPVRSFCVETTDGLLKKRFGWVG